MFELEKVDHWALGSRLFSRVPVASYGGALCGGTPADKSSRACVDAVLHQWFFFPRL
ncbi:hypothetical protein CYLTODRAFT_420274 [Cylindrobasidium torrendii FP15055 ss-10]|uniref:Uncharacterized protein n=1 Tax=Cylindrobasidium torrendii FP15055 ss-10 TaxID=1314674 RepID=A0A0D7BGY0_9AGAR|nr:hypothetical protein CYLTODRAFT_420274 [Cylindrobasidium torrendii FP15055 ss-10]